MVYSGSRGTAEVMGAKMAEKNINAAGGIMGRPLKVIYEDTQCKVQDAAGVAKRLILEERCGCPAWRDMHKCDQGLV